MISGAEREIIIQTPYYIPSDALHESIKLALLSGVQVKMLIPNKPDHPLVYWATYFHAADLVKYGAKVYTYENGFVHSKTLIIDGSMPQLVRQIWIIEAYNYVLKQMLLFMIMIFHKNCEMIL